MRHPAAPAPGALLGPHYGQCFGCGTAQPHGLHLLLHAAEGVRVTGEFTVRPAHQGAPGLAHGGVLTTALDEAMGSLSWLMQAIMVTGRLEADFLRPVPVGAVLHLSAEAVAVHGRKVYATSAGRLDGPAGPLAVRADAVFVRVEAEHFERDVPRTGRDEETGAALPDPDRARRARAFEVNP